MSAQTLLTQLESRGVRLSADGERLRVSAPAGQLDDELKSRIGALKPQLLALLTARRPGPEGEYPVSFAQRRLWFLDQLEPGNVAYHLGAAHVIRSAIDPALMEAAVNDVVKRQGALRTVFREADGEPVQVVRHHQPQALPFHDLSALPRDEAEQAQRRLIQDEAARPFDLASGPLFRAALVRTAPDHHRLLFTLHHIVCDGWSLGIFLQDLHVAYTARLAGQSPVYPMLTRHFGEHAADERATLAGERLEKLLTYWRGRLASASPTLDLPTDRPRPRQRTFGGDAVYFKLTPALSDALRALAHGERATLYMVLLAIFKVLLFRYSGQTDIVVGTPVANRHSRETEQVIGMFVGTLPIRSDLDPGLTLRGLIAQMRENVLEAQAHAALPFDKMVDELRPERNPAWTPIFQVLFTLQNTPLASEFEVTTVATMVDLSMFMWDEPGRIRGTLEYNTALFDAATATRLGDHFVTLCASAVATPDQTLGRLPMIDAAQREQLLHGWNATARPYPRESNLATLFAAAAQRHPQAVALENANAGAEVLPVARLTYAELAAGSDRLAARLRDHGVSPGDSVGLYVERSVGAVVAILAIVKLGAAYVPLDVGDPPGRTRGILRDAGVRIALTQRSTYERLGCDAPTLVLEDEWSATSAGAVALAPDIAADALAYVMFTSGSTGVPKGVCVSHRNVARLVCNTDYVELGPQEALLQFAPLAFDASTLEIWGALLNGARLVVHPQTVPTAAELAQVLRTRQITTLWLTAGFFQHMVESQPQALAEVRQVLAGGDVLSVSHVQRLLDAKAGGVVVNGYGPTENTTFTCCHRMAPGLKLADTVPIGRPIANTRVYLLDAYGEPVPPGVAGELTAAGDGVAAGYLRNADMTAEKFVTDPFAGTGEGRMYRTGDLARWRVDGTIEFLGRRDRQVKLRGFRIELEEIEDALRRQASVRDAAVVVRTDASGSAVLVGYIVPRDPASFDVAPVKQALADRLPSYMVPGLFPTLPAMPLTASGKLDRAALPAPDAPAVNAGAIEPRTVVEAQLHAILERLIGRTGIGVTDNFFDLGGHSLLAVRLFAQIERVFGIRLPVSTLFVAPDIVQLAQRLQDAGFHSPWSSLVLIQSEGSRRPLFMVPGVGGNVLCFSDLARLLGTDQPLYALQARGLDDKDPPFERIEPMAAHYLLEIRQVQPSGPYRIGGTCFGGVVAYEMARQLRAAGEQVEMLFMLEAWPPPATRPFVDALLIRSYRLRFLILAIGRNLQKIRRPTVRELVRAPLSALHIVRDLWQRGMYRGDQAKMYGDRVSLANQRALLRYQLRGYDGPLRFAAAAQRPITGQDARRVWRTLAPTDYAQIELQSKDSGTMLMQPDVKSLARWMESVIEELDKQPHRDA